MPNQHCPFTCATEAPSCAGIGADAFCQSDCEARRTAYFCYCCQEDTLPGQQSILNFLSPVLSSAAAFGELMGIGSHDGSPSPAGDRASLEHNQGHCDLGGTLPQRHLTPGRKVEPPPPLMEAAMCSGSMPPEKTLDPKAYHPAAQGDSGATGLACISTWGPYIIISSIRLP